jgi:hypothetical protein
MAPRYLVTAFDMGLAQHRLELGSLIASGLAPRGEVPSRWTVARVTSKGLRWSLRPLTAGEVRGIRKCGCRTLAAILRAIERGKLRP